MAINKQNEVSEASWRDLARGGKDRKSQ